MLLTNENDDIVEPQSRKVPANLGLQIPLLADLWNGARGQAGDLV